MSSSTRLTGAKVSGVVLSRIYKVGFPVRVRNVHAFMNRHNVEGLLELWQPFFSHGDSSVVQFMFKYNVAILFICSILVRIDPAFKVAVHSGWREVAATVTRHVPVVAIFVPDDGPHTHLPSDGTNAIINITIWRTPAARCDSCGFFDSTKSPIELCNYLIV